MNSNPLIIAAQKIALDKRRRNLNLANQLDHTVASAEDPECTDDKS